MARTVSHPHHSSTAIGECDAHALGDAAIFLLRTFKGFSCRIMGRVGCVQEDMSMSCPRRSSESVRRWNDAGTSATD